MGRSRALLTRLPLAVSLLLCLGLAAPSVAMPRAPGTPYATGSHPSAVAVGDFNGDGHADLAVANAGADSVSVLLGDGTGRFGPKTDVAVGAWPQALCVGDFGDDGKQDLAVACSNLGAVSVLLGDGTGGFGRTDLVVGPLPLDVTVGDFNGDGEDDLATAISPDNAISVLLGDGSGGFAGKTDFGTGSWPCSVAVGDVDGDGSQDIATANYDGASCSVLFGDGAGVFAGASESTYANPVAVTLEDVNGDGKDDLVDVCAYDPYSYTGKDMIGIRLWQGALFGAGWGIVMPDTALNDVVVADLNNDGKQDLATVGGQVNKLYIYLGNGTGEPGGFRLQSVVATGTAPFAVAAGRLDGDARLDLVTADNWGNTATVVLNKRLQGITAIKPARARVGTRVTITGWGFGTKRGTAKVYFGSKVVSKYVAWGMNKIVVKAPAVGKGRKAVTVRTALGKTNVKYFLVL